MYMGLFPFLIGFIYGFTYMYMFTLNNMSMYYTYIIWDTFMSIYGVVPISNRFHIAVNMHFFTLYEDSFHI